MNTVLIADDELIIRQGLKCIIDWEELGFTIAGEASNGVDALHFILEKNPDLVLLDIRMPRLLGVDVVQQARDNGYEGHIIILSGFTDFKYAQAAIRYGVDFYLTKPIDEDELLDAVRSLKDTLEKQGRQSDTWLHYRQKAHGTILLDILTNTADFSQININDFHLDAECYQVVIYENYSHATDKISYPFSDLLKVTNEQNSSYENITIDHNEVLLLKGEYTLHKFEQFLEHYERDQKPQKDSPLDSLFITYGRPVSDLEKVYISYQEALRLLQRRFFCEHKQHTIGYHQLPAETEQDTFQLTQEMLQEYCDSLIGYIQAAKRNQMAEALRRLEKNLYTCHEDIPQIKLFLTDLYLSIKERISHLYHTVDISFPSNAEIIEFINSKYYLYEIILYFTEQFKMIIQTIGNPSSDGVMDDIIHYIEHNYMDNIKLENIAPLFGYNSSYLGKIFSKKVGEGFNVFVDKIRIEHSKELLTESSLKVYEIAEKVGYRNVDYFHTKFKKYVNQSPAEYRKYMRLNSGKEPV
jgi:two-component system response regulator YesN